MNRMIQALCAVAVMLTGLTASAQTLPSGHYGMGEGAGRLDIGPPNTAGVQAFELNTEGVNGHSCGLEGQILRGEARPDTHGEPVCVVRFALTPSGAIAVSTPTQDNCRWFCGARAGFEATYQRLPAQCTDAAWSQGQDEFLRAHKQGDHAHAAAMHSARLKTCERWLRWSVVMRVRNDLAVAQLRAGDKAGCLRTLKPLFAMDKQYFESAPMEKPEFDHLLKAARHNRRLCSQV